MRRFARVDPLELDKITARKLDPVELKNAWLQMSDEAREKMLKVADETPNLPIGVAFVNQDGEPEWIGDDPALRVHAPSLRGCWPTLRLE